MKHSLKGQRGYTAVELMMAIGIFGIGVTGIIGMQKVTVVSNQHAKNLGIATHIAESWLDMLATDAVTWNHPSATNAAPDIGQTTWLRLVKSNANTVNDWVLPTYSPELAFGPAFDALGNPIDPGTAADGAVAFCSHLRLSWLYQPTVSGNGLIRAEVRVFWVRDGQGFAQDMCDNAQVANVGAAKQTFHFVQKITAIRENTL
ncbi:MAG TPA: prepilin-type N-terminal cleavage/methylation domain-containing protein [Polyangiaceae bacterium]|nr:prepilin-type N-terminal cleavage/methylation domain-containing protein [Polyangiaceae bacterium]